MFVATATALDAYSLEFARTQGRPRSGQWRAFQAKLIEGHPFCAACGRNHGLIAHHILPFWKYPKLELVESNILILGEDGTINCHLWIGHLGSFFSWNVNAVNDAVKLSQKIKGRP